jgi:hypothetical protein
VFGSPRSACQRRPDTSAIGFARAFRFQLSDAHDGLVGCAFVRPIRLTEFCQSADNPHGQLITTGAAIPRQLFSG